MEINNFDKLVNLVTENILNKIDLKTKSRLDSNSCLVIMPNISLGLEEYFNKIRKTHPAETIYFAIDENYADVEAIKNLKNLNIVKYDIKNSKFINAVGSAKSFMVIGLKFNELRKLTSLEDEEAIVQTILLRLQAGKKVELLLSANQAIASKIAETIFEAKRMGIEVTNIKDTTDSQSDKVKLITESYVMNLKKTGVKNLVLDKKQLITPLAKDKLREYKIDIKYIEEDQS